MAGKRVYVWGFEPEALRDWPGAFAPVDEWPTDEGPVLVEFSAAETFVRMAKSHPLAYGRLVNAILWLPPGRSLPGALAGYFDATVKSGDWETLSGLLACPEQFGAGEWAEDLPVATISRLERDGLSPDFDAERLPLPAAARRHLSECSACRAAFRIAVEERMLLHADLLCPPLAEPEEDEEQEGPAWGNIWLALPLRWSSLPAISLPVRSSGGREWLEQFMQAWLAGGFQPQAALDASPEAGMDESQAEKFARLLLAGESLTMKSAGRELTLQLETDEAVLWVEHLRRSTGERPDLFHLDLIREGETLWEGESRGGRVAIPLSALLLAMTTGSVQLRLTTLHAGQPSDNNAGELK